MGTRIDDVYADMALEEEAKWTEEDEIIQRHKADGVNIERAKEIFGYLPIRRGQVEDNYINHLWDAFITLDSYGEGGQPFLIMPFHLLFMLTIQFKTLRLAKENDQAAKLFFSGVGGRYKQQLLAKDLSVFDIGSIYESTIPEIFQLMPCDEGLIKSIKNLIKDRNDNLAHAKGGIDLNPESKIIQYLKILEKLQLSCTNSNLMIVNLWLKDINSDMDIDQFLESHFLELYFSPNDFGDSIFVLFNSRKINLNQFDLLINKGLSISFDKTLVALTLIALENKQASRRFKALEALNENGMISPELKKIILEKETDPRIKLFLK